MIGKKEEEKRKPGRPSKIGGRAKKVFLDDKTIADGEEIGNGNLSEGLRIAVKHCKAHMQKAGA